MPKTFEYKEAKILIDYYKELLNNLKKTSTVRQNSLTNLNQYIRKLHDNGFFSDVVDNGIKGKELNFDDHNLISLLSNIYYFIEISKCEDVCEDLYDNYSSLVERYIASLSSGKNALFWLFSSNKKKSNAEEAYDELSNLKNSQFVLTSNEMLNKINDLKKRDFQIIKEDYLNNKDKYKKWLQEANETVFIDNGVIPLFNKYLKEFDSILNNLSIVKNSIDENIDAIKASVNRLLTDELVNTLRGIPVDELARDKSGIKTSYLKAAGYNNLADIYAASVAQLASVYGISQDKAYTIKSNCNSKAKILSRELKIKLSIDNKSKTATNVVQSLYCYLKKMEYSKMIDQLDLEYGNELKDAFKNLDNVGNGIKWLFLTNDEINEVIKDYEYVKNTLTVQYKPIADNICKEFKKLKINFNDAWNDFSNDSIKYYNALEEICPDVLGTDDAIYGLPEDLARQIQDECFFPDGLLCTLRKYQEWGVKYVLHQEKVLLGDEMGLGKTIQAIATMVSLKNTNATHFLVVCPASVVTNWCREISKHSKLRVTQIYGSGKATSFKSWLKTGGVGVTNFESTSYIKLDDDYKFDLLVVDEAHYIKNPGARRSINTRNLALHTNRLLFMTGTALENNVDEMISLIDVLRPSIADSLKHYAFMSSAPQFREKIAPVYYRRKREDVLTELPDKIESPEWCSLNPEEEEAYENAVLSKNYTRTRCVSWDIDDLNKSSKAQRLKEIVLEAEEEGRKVLVFSFFLETIAKIHEFLKGKCLNPINGSINVNRRQEIIDEFDKAPAGTVLLAQINSGGTGLNIQSASVVVICEPQFKPSVENQAISRAYRMGQSRNVLVYRLLCEGTVDEKLITTLEEKQKIFDAFADKSVAGQESLEVDNKTFGDIIKEEIDRINKKRGVKSEASEDIRVEKEKPKAPDLKKYDYNPLVENETGKAYYEKLMKMSYDELVQYLINKYGPAKYDYFTNEFCTIKNRKVTRTNEGLYCHHIDEDKAILLSEEDHAKMNPFEYQKADRLVYCNLLEHFLLHILIAEEPKNKNANKFETQGIGGAVCFLCPELNDIYNGYENKIEWKKNTISVIKDDYESYIVMLKRLWQLIKNEKLTLFYSKNKLASGFDGTLYHNILKELD